MRSTTLLLAVSVVSHLATAAVIRHGPFARSGNLVRSFNQSSIPAAPVGQRSSSTTDTLTAATSTLATSTPSVKANSLPLAQAASVTSILPSKQVGSVPAVGNGAGAASIESNATTTSIKQPFPSVALPSSTASKPSLTAALPSPTDSEPSIAATTKQVGSVPAVGNGPGAASIESSAPIIPSITSLPSVALPSSVTSKPSLATASSSTAGRAPQSPPTVKTTNSPTRSTSFSRLFTLGTGVGGETNIPSASETPQGQTSSLSPSAQPSGVSAGSSSVASVSSPSQSSAATITDIPFSTDIPGRDENIKVANQFNSYFDTMNPNSGCNAAFNSQATVCINKQLATCSDQKYILTPCQQGQECRALPLDNGSRGIYVHCITPSEAAAKLSPGQSSSIPSTATSSSPNPGSVTQKATVPGPSSTATQESVTPSGQPGKSSETSLSTGASILPTTTISSAATPTFSSAPTTTIPKPSSSTSSAVASPTPNNAGSPSSIIPSATADKTTESTSVVPVPTTLLTSTKPSKNPAPASEASTAPSAQTSASDLPNGSEPGISIIPEPRITDNPARPTSTGVLPVVINAAAGPVTTSNTFPPDSRVTVRETVTVTTTVHD